MKIGAPVTMRSLNLPLTTLCLTSRTTMTSEHVSGEEAWHLATLVIVIISFLLSHAFKTKSWIDVYKLQGSVLEWISLGALGDVTVIHEMSQSMCSDNLFIQSCIETIPKCISTFSTFIIIKYMLFGRIELQMDRESKTRSRTLSKVKGQDDFVNILLGS